MFALYPESLAQIHFPEVPGDATMKSPHHEEYSSSDFQHARLNKFYHPKRFQMFDFVFSDSLVADGVGVEHSSPGPFWGVCAIEHEKLLSRESWPCWRRRNVVDTCPEIENRIRPSPHRVLTFDFPMKRINICTLNYLLIL